MVIVSLSTVYNGQSALLIFYITYIVGSDIMNQMVQNVTDTIFEIAKRLYYKYDNPEITSLYKY